MYYEACFCRANPMAYYMNKIEGHWLTLASQQKSPLILVKLLLTYGLIFWVC